MANYKLVIEYDGTNYNGFQIQPNGITVQGLLEEALSRIAKTEVKIIAAGRTDAGVHAFNQVVNFNANLTVPVERMAVALNSLLPKDIRVRGCEIVPDSFHARYDAVEKTYLYRIRHGQIESAFEYKYCWWLKRELDWDLIEQAGLLLVGTHDFAGFAASGSGVKTTVRTISNYSLTKAVNGGDIRFTADGFLYNMVRNMVGTLVEIGLGKRPVEDIPRILCSRDRTQAGVTAPAQGLFLESIIYPDLT